MFRNKKVVVVMPAYNAARTLKRTYDEVMARGIVDLVIIVDDGSKDDTVAVARTLPNTVLHRPSRPTKATAPIRRRAIGWRWRPAPTSSS